MRCASKCASTPGSEEELLAVTPEKTQITDPELLAYFEQRVALTSELFGLKPPAEHPVVLFERPARQPERVVVCAEPFVSFIYIHEQNHFSCARYELAHEAVHEALARERTIFDWVQEMFAEYVALLAVRELGLALGLPGTVEYGEDRERQHRENATLLPLRDLRAADMSVAYPDHSYARAFVTACELVDAIGWNRLQPLGTMLKGDQHNLNGWLENLGDEEGIAARNVLDATP